MPRSEKPVSYAVYYDGGYVGTCSASNKTEACNQAYHHNSHLFTNRRKYTAKQR